jgi:hypothetical protein
MLGMSVRTMIDMPPTVPTSMLVSPPATMTVTVTARTTADGPHLAERVIQFTRQRQKIISAQ